MYITIYYVYNSMCKTYIYIYIYVAGTLTSVNSFQTTLTPNPDKSYTNITLQQNNQNHVLNVLSEGFQVPMPAVWKSFTQGDVTAALRVTDALKSADRHELPSQANVAAGLGRLAIRDHSSIVNLIIVY